MQIDDSSPVPTFTKQDEYLTPKRFDTDTAGHLTLPKQSKDIGRNRSSSRKRFNWVHGNSPRNACPDTESKPKFLQVPAQTENTYLTPESRGRDLTDATNFSRFQEIHNAPEKRPTCPDSSVKHRKRRDDFNPENVKVPPFKLEFVDSEEDDHTAAMKEIRKDYAGFTHNIMNVEIGNNLLPFSSGMQMRI